MSISRRLRKWPPMLGISVVIAVLKGAMGTTSLGQGVSYLTLIDSNLHLSGTKLIWFERIVEKRVGGNLTKRK